MNKKDQKNFNINHLLILSFLVIPVFILSGCNKSLAPVFGEITNIEKIKVKGHRRFPTVIKVPTTRRGYEYTIKKPNNQDIIVALPMHWFHSNNYKIGDKVAVIQRKKDIILRKPKANEMNNFNIENYMDQ